MRSILFDLSILPFALQQHDQMNEGKASALDEKLRSF